MKIQLGSAILTGLLICSPLALQAQDASQHMDQGASMMMKSADVHFMMKAAQGGMAEVKLGQLATEKGSNPDVKVFGQKMIDDHTKANDQLKSIAQEQGVNLPTSLNGKDQATYDRLSRLSGAEFDKQYAKHMLMDHQEDVKDFQKEANNGKDEKVKSFASQTLPVLQQHLQMVKDMQSKVSAGSSM